MPLDRRLERVEPLNEDTLLELARDCTATAQSALAKVLQVTPDSPRHTEIQSIQIGMQSLWQRLKEIGG